MLATVFSIVTVIIIIGNSIVNESFEGEIPLYIVLCAISGLVWIRPVVASCVRGSEVYG